MRGFILSKLFKPRTLERVLRERLSEPLHLNLLSIPVALFGSTRAKIYFDLMVRQQHAYGLLKAAERAAKLKQERVTVIEFGVANGAGLMNLCRLAAPISKETGIGFDIVGFDAGTGMPDLLDYRDHPEFYQPHWFPMQAPERLQAALPENAKLILGPIRQTLARFEPSSPIGFVSIDVDYYSSTLDCLTLFTREPTHYQPVVDLYLDDVHFAGHNEWCGELRAVREFSDAHDNRRIARTNFLRESRLFKNASWISHFYSLYVLDHPARNTALHGKPPVILGNPYLGLSTVG